MVRQKQTFQKILTFLIILGIFLKSTRVVSLNYLLIFRGPLTSEEIQLQQLWRNPLFGNNCNETECGNERTIFDFFVSFTDENGQTL